MSFDRKTDQDFQKKRKTVKGPTTQFIDVARRMGEG